MNKKTLLLMASLVVVAGVKAAEQRTSGQPKTALRRYQPVNTAINRLKKGFVHPAAANLPAFQISKPVQIKMFEVQNADAIVQPKMITCENLEALKKSDADNANNTIIVCNAPLKKLRKTDSSHDSLSSLLMGDSDSEPVSIIKMMKTMNKQS